MKMDSRDQHRLVLTIWNSTKTQNAFSSVQTDAMRSVAYVAEIDFQQIAFVVIIITLYCKIKLLNYFCVITLKWCKDFEVKNM